MNNRTVICPNCHNEIEVDHLSNFCQVCGAPIKNEEELRRQAKDIAKNYRKGYEYYLNLDSVPRLVQNPSIESCEKIIAKRQEIIKKHEELELGVKRKEVSHIHDMYKKGYDFFSHGGHISQFKPTMSLTECDNVISLKFRIIQKHRNIIAEEAKLREIERQKQIKKEQEIKEELPKQNHSSSFNLQKYLIIVLSCYAVFGYCIYCHAFASFNISGGGTMLLFVCALIIPPIIALYFSTTNK